VVLPRAYPQQTHEMLFDAHNHAFRVLGGVPRRGIYDNMRTAIDKVGRGKERQVNARFVPWSATSCSRPGSAIRPPAGRRADREERSGCSSPALAADPEFSLAGGAERLAGGAMPRTVGRDPAQRATRTVAEAWREEAQHLMQLPRPFDGFVEYAKRVSPTCLIHLERNRYSVPASFANCPSACGYTLSASSSPPRGKSCASTPASSPVRMTTRA